MATNINNSKKKKNPMKFPSIFKSNKPDHKPWDWDWDWDWSSPCKHPKTLSFRSPDDLVFKTVNSIFFDDHDTTSPDSPLFTNNSSSATNSTHSHHRREFILDGDSLETLVRGARSERLFFEPDDTSSILEKSKAIESSIEESSEAKLGFEESLIVSIESENPYEDFRKSMGEMVESHGVRDWDGLEELLGWYLKSNWKNNHRFIIGAFVDLLVDILLASSSSSRSNSDSNYYTCTESSSNSSSSCVSSSLRSLDRSIRQEVHEEDDDDRITEIIKKKYMGFVGVVHPSQFRSDVDQIKLKKTTIQMYTFL